MKAIADFPYDIYFDDHVLPMMSEPLKAYLMDKYAVYFKQMVLPVLNRGFEKYYGRPAPAMHEPTLYELLTYEMLPFDSRIMDTLPKPTISPQVLMELSAGNVPAGVEWDIDQVRMFARWLDSDRLERVDPPYAAGPSADATHHHDDDGEEHWHFRLKKYTRHNYH